LTELAHGLRIASTLACGVVLVAFVLFAVDQRDESTRYQPAQAAIAEPVLAQEVDHDGARGVVEEVNATLVGPFEGVAASDDPWVQHGVPALLALLAYGLLARLLIGYIPARR
jgi:hypothetical protein